METLDSYQMISNTVCTNECVINLIVLAISSKGKNIIHIIGLTCMCMSVLGVLSVYIYIMRSLSVTRKINDAYRGHRIEG